MLRSATIVRLHDEATAGWHRAEAYAAGEEVLAELVLEQHRANYDLWHEEDEARSPDASDAMIARVKHAIDGLNQRRNDLVEQIDLRLLREAGEQNESAPLHSETPGLIVDRLSILALKIFHTAEESRRESASEEHRERNRARLDILMQQRSDLAGCLDELWEQVIAGQRRFRLYRQMKMYNDPELNPAVYRKSA
jgi:Protein of unknown function (DUF4254)